MKNTILTKIDQHAKEFKAISRYIANHPEVGHQELLAVEQLTRILHSHGFQIEQQPLQMPTAFIARYVSEKSGPTIALFAEYDALPEIGHACGHHLICMMSVGAAIGLQSVISQIGGEIRVYGTPAEESDGAKVTMVKAGMFRDIDIALMAHPYDKHERSGTSLALDAIEFEFFGRSAHAAISPHEGINALDSVILLFQSINALRQHILPDARIHGIIHKGGQAPNLIPEYAACRFYVRSAQRAYTDMLTQKIIRCAEGASIQTGCKFKYTFYQNSYDELHTNQQLSKVYTDNLIQLGVNPEEIYNGQDFGSLDLGNVSRVCPTIHPFIKVVNQPLQLHTVAFRDAAVEEYALDAMILGAKALACTSYDVITQPSLLLLIQEEFKNLSFDFSKN